MPNQISAWDDPEHDAWWGFSGRMGEYVRSVSTRGDLRARIYPHAVGADARITDASAAYFVPQTAAFTINASRTLSPVDDPAAIDLSDYRHQAAYPVLTGSTLHEVSHADHSHMIFGDDVDEDLMRWVGVLEESRCERRFLARRPQDREYISAGLSATLIESLESAPILGQDQSEQDRRNYAGYVAGMVLARVDTGVLPREVALNLYSVIEQSLSADDISVLRVIWRTAQFLGDTDADAMLACARSYRDVLNSREPNPQDQEQAQEAADRQQEQESSSQGAESSQSDQSGQDEDSDEEQSSAQRGDSDSDDSANDGEQSENSQDSSSSTEEGSTSEQGSGAESGQESSSEDGESEGGSSNEDSEGSSGSESSSNGSAGSDAEANATGDASEADNPQETGSARRMPCGSWTRGRMSEDVDPAQSSSARPEFDEPQAQADMHAEILQRMEDFAQSQAEALAINAGIRFEAEEIAAAAQRHAEQTREDVARLASATTAEQVFGADNRGAGQGMSTSGGTFTVTDRVADAQTVTLSNRLRRSIRDARFRDISRSRTASVAPPGRVRVNALARRESQVAMNVRVTATPWEITRRRVVDQPPLTVGIATDISGSMEAWQNPVANFTWSLAKAVRGENGTVASVAWNSRPKALISPRGRLDKVLIPTCNGGSSGCPSAIDALDGGLHLLGTDGVRMLVVVTDADLPNMSIITQKVKRLREDGVIVLWIITGSSSGHYSRVREIIGAENVYMNSPDQFATVVSQRITQALEEEDKKQQQLVR